MQTENLFNKFLEIIDELEKEKVDYMLVGGFAMVLRGMPRATNDLDIFIKNRKENIELLQKALYTIFNNKNVFEITHSELTDYNVIRYGADEGFYVDVLSRIGTAFSYEDLKYEEINVKGHRIKIATVETLYRLKEKTFMAIDKTDLIFLRQLLESRK